MLKTILSGLGSEKAFISVLITDDQGIREINRQWLGRDRPTDVIAFSQIEGEPVPTDFIGDVVVSVETAKRQAQERGLTLDQELARLLAHGVLHLLGHDHVRGGRMAARMRALEDELVRAAMEDDA